MLEVFKDLLLFGYFFDDVLSFNSQVKDLLDCLGWQLPELLSFECKPRHVYFFDPVLFKEIPNIFNELNSIHAGHSIVNDDKGDLVLLLLIVEKLEVVQQVASR